MERQSFSKVGTGFHREHQAALETSQCAIVAVRPERSPNPARDWFRNVSVQVSDCVVYRAIDRRNASYVCVPSHYDI